MKKIILGLILISFLALPVLVAGATAPAEVKDLDVFDTLAKVVNLMFSVLLIFASIFIVIAGFSFVTAGGDPEKVKTARQMIIYAIIGIAVALLSKGIVTFVGTYLQ